MRPELQWERIIQALADQAGIALTQDGLGGAVAQGNLIRYIRS